MANHKSAIKRHRQNLERRARNRFVRSTVRTDVKSVLGTVEAGNAADAKKALSEAVSTISKAASKGVLKKQTASRKIARLSKKVNALNAS
ncbi:MAG: 30S ribosomal protein S20 [Deltaproteobacteria bacterium]|nr:30S ribosomal protein S20 [Deltaproteobacteria bacterium]